MTNSIREIQVILDTIIGHSVCSPDETEETCTLVKAETAINAYILGEVMELLGEDEPNRPLLQMRNELRQELRNKANEKFGGK